MQKLEWWPERAALFDPSLCSCSSRVGRMLTLGHILGVEMTVAFLLALIVLNLVLSLENVRFYD